MFSDFVYETQTAGLEPTKWSVRLGGGKGTVLDIFQTGLEDSEVEKG